MDKDSNHQIIGKISLLIGFLLAAYIPLRYLHISGFNFWMDWTGFLDLQSDFSRYFLMWNPNQLGQIQFSSFALIPLYLFSRVIYNVFSINRGTFLVLFFINLLNLILAYIFVKQFTNKKLFCFLFSLLFIFNPIYLRNLLVTGTVSTIFSLIGFLLGFIFFNKFKITKNINFVLLTIISSLLVVHPFYFVFYISLLTYLYLIEFGKKTTIRLVIGIILINMLWILPYIVSINQQSVSGILAGRTADVKITLDRTANIINNFSFNIRGSAVLNNIYSYFSYFIILIWVLFFSITLFNSKSSKPNFLLYLLPLLLMLIFSLGGSKPFGYLFNLLWNNFPLMGFFRSYSNILFFVWYFLLFLILIKIKQTRLIDSRTFRFILIGIVLIFVLPISLYGGISNYGGTTDIPQEYFDFSSFISADNTTSHIFILPQSRYDYYKWDNSNKDKYFLKYFFNKGAINSNLQFGSEDPSTIGQIYNKTYNTHDLTFLGGYNIKYVLFRKDLLYANKSYFLPINQSLFKNIEIIDSNEYFEVYKIPNSNYTPIISGNNIFFSKSSNIQYSIYIDNINGLEDLAFLESYDPGWKIYLVKNPTRSWCTLLTSYNTTGVIECNPDPSFEGFGGLSPLLGKPIFEENHSTFLGYANKWTINSDHILEKYPPEYYTKNVDGSIGIELILYFKPQSSFIVGLIISSLTIVLCLYYLFYNSMKRKNKDHNETK